MNLTYLTTDSKIGGAEKVVLYLAEGMKKRGHNPRIVALLPGGSLAEESSDLGIPYLCCGAIKGSRMAAMNRLAAELKSNRPDILHCHLFHANVAGILAARATKTRLTVVTEHGLDVIGGTARNILRVCYARFADGIIAISESSARKLRGFPFMPVNRVKTIHNGIPPVAHPFEKKEILNSIGCEEDPGEILIASLSHFRREKGVDIGVEAFADPRLQRHKVRLILVGSGVMETELREQCRRLGISDRVIFTGFRSDAATILSACDIFLLSSHEEGLPITLLEAASLGKAAVASNVGGVPEVITSEENGLLVSPGNPGGFARALVRLVENDALRADLGRSLNDCYRARFSVDSMVEETMRYYETIREP